MSKYMEEETINNTAAGQIREIDDYIKENPEITHVSFEIGAGDKVHFPIKRKRQTNH